MFRVAQRSVFLSRSQLGAASAARVTAARALSSKPTMIYTETDEAPNLATYSLLPVIKKMVSMAGINVVKSDISLSGRVLAHFPEKLKPEQRVNDELTRLGKWWLILCVCIIIGINI
jgi:monomeric isocitrate dehydrogenase